MKAAGLNVTAFPAEIRHVVLLNPNKPPFDSQTVRQTFAAAIQSINATAVSGVLGSDAAPARSAYQQARSHGSQAQSEQLYSQAGELSSQDAYVLPIDDTQDVIVSSSSLTGLKHVPTFI